MALTRTMLKSMGLTEEQVSAIIEEHVATVEGLKKDRDDWKAKAGQVDAGELEALKKDKARLEADLKAANEAKDELEKRDAKRAKETAYAGLLKEAGISEKRTPAILRVTDLSDFKPEMDDATRAAVLTRIRNDWSEFIVKEEERGAKTPDPHKDGGDGGDDPKPSAAAALVARYHQEHYGTKKED